MEKIYNKDRKAWMGVRDYFVVYGADITKWPALICPGSDTCPSGEHTLVVHNFKALGINLTARNSDGEEHRTPPRAEISFDHRRGEAKDCPRRFKDIGQFDDLTKNTVDPAAAKKTKAEFYIPHNFDRTVKITQKLLGENYSEDLFKELVGLMDKNNIWSGNFQPWLAPYLLLQQKTFDYTFKNGNTHRVRFLADKERTVLHMVFAGSSNVVKAYGPYPMNEMEAARIAMADKKPGAQLKLNFG